MLVLLIKLALTFAHPSKSTEWITEQGHVQCFDTLDPISLALADAVCAAKE